MAMRTRSLVIAGALTLAVSTMLAAGCGSDDSSGGGGSSGKDAGTGASYAESHLLLSRESVEVDG